MSTELFDKVKKLISNHAYGASLERWPVTTPAEASDYHSRRMEYGLGYEHGIAKGVAMAIDLLKETDSLELSLHFIEKYLSEKK